VNATRKVHFMPEGAPIPQCAALRSFTWNIRTTVDPNDVTCLVCLYWLGRYVPLVKLKEHQDATKTVN